MRRRGSLYITLGIIPATDFLDFNPGGARSKYPYDPVAPLQGRVRADEIELQLLCTWNISGVHAKSDNFHYNS